MATTKHILVALVEDKPGVLNRMASLFRRRGFNIESIAVGQSETPQMSRMTFVVNGPAEVVEQVRKQLDKVVEIVKVSDITGDKVVARELAMIKVKANSANRSEIMQIVDVFRANIVDVAPDSVIIEVTGDEDKISSLLNLVRSFGVKEIARTGLIAMTRGISGPLPVTPKTAKAQPKESKTEEKESENG
jgi:acetolactate synthase-1/3 small subunit